MSPSAGLEAVNRSASPVGALKRKREAPELVYPRPSPHAESSKPPRQTNGFPQTSSSGGSSSNSNNYNYNNNNSILTRVTSANDIHHRSPLSDETHQNEGGDTLHGIGSASSRASAASSVFSNNSTVLPHHRKHSLANNLTPLTNHSDFSSPKGNSPRYSGATTSMAHNSSALHVPVAHQPPHERPQRPQMLPTPGKVKGYRAVWDPELDGKLSKEERKRATARRKEFGTETFELDPPPDPRLAIPGYMSGNCRPKTQPSKAILRIAPYPIPPYKVDRHSVGPGEAQQVVASGFDPFMPEATLKLNFSTFGSVISVQNKTDPETGSFLGIALIRYRDSFRDGIEVTAAAAAKRAESEFNGSRIGTSQVRVELDREGRKCKRHVEHTLKRAREARAKDNSVAPPPPPPEEPVDAAKALPAPPPNAPKGPSGKASTKPPEGPRGVTAAAASGAAGAAAPTVAAPSSKAGAAALIEEESVLGKIKRKPYIFIPHSSVPVLGTTIPHLKKRLKSYDWREVRLDKSGYFVIFDDSKRGEDETERCFVECNKAALFTYTMEMECQKYGNPDYERSPSPERALAEQQKRVQFERLKSEEEADMEIEKKVRAEGLDPIEGVLERLRIELRDKILDDIKTRIAISIFHDSLEPTKHATKRTKLGLPDPSDNENKAPTLLFNKAGDTPPHTPKSRHGYPLSHSKPLRPHDPNQQRGRKGDRDKGPSNVFADERRRRPAPKPSHARGLHFRLQQMFAEEEDSDDERHTSITRDTEDQESRPLSRASRNSTPASESVTETPKHKRRKVAEWEDEDKETFDAFHSSMLGHLLHKEPEDLATRELELVVNTLPRTSKYATRARTELFIRQRSKADDDLFQIKTHNARHLENDHTEAEDVNQEQINPLPASVDTKAVKEKPAGKKASRRKTKTQPPLEEQEVLREEAKKVQVESEQEVVEAATEVEEKEIKVVNRAADKDIESSLTYDKPRRTVEEDRAVPLDIDGWQYFIKDDEDLAFAKRALTTEVAQDIGNVKLWAWKQKEIKTLNTCQVVGDVRSECMIPGYYVQNASGCARTEGVIKILNEEKSKYLPHRIKVQKAREERLALAKSNPTAAAEAARITAAEKFASTATSRSNRVNNRRLVNDINLQKQNLTAHSDADVAIRFNQLKKRKKLVKFDRSAIHGWGLYAEENIAVNDLIIEYVGEKVRQKVADLRELKYEKQGIGSSYLFRMVDDEIVDATKKGGIARFINHSCSPNCTAKIIKVEGTPRIVIYAMKDILKNEELTYDYKFEREYGSTDRIPCLCGSANCKGFLN